MVNPEAINSDSARECHPALSGPSTVSGRHHIGSRPVLLEFGPPIVLCALLVMLCVLESPFRRFHIDEIYSYFLLADPSFSHMLGARADLINASPPFYFIMGWLWAKAFGDSEVALRLFSCLGYCVGSASMWWLLRRTFGWWPAVVGTYVVFLSSNEFLEHNCEARFYGMLFAETALATCTFAALCVRKKPGVGILLANALVHGALVTTHYLAFLYCAAFMLAFGLVWFRDVRAIALRCGSILVGWLAFVPCVPGFVHHQAFGKPHGWIPPPHLGDLLTIYGTARSNMAPIVLAFAVLGIFLDLLTSGVVRQTEPETEEDRNSSNRSLTLLILALCLLLVPCFLYGASKAAAPMFLIRYLLPPLLIGWSIIVASLVQKLSAGRRRCYDGPRRSDKWSALRQLALATVPQFVFAALALFCIFNSWENYRRFLSGPSASWQEDTKVLRAIERLPSDTPILFVDTHLFFCMEHYSDRRPQLVLLVDKDWAYSTADTVPRKAPNDFLMSIALKNQYSAQVRDAADFWRENDRAIYVLGTRNRSLFEKWSSDKRFTFKSLSDESELSVVLVERKKSA